MLEEMIRFWFAYREVEAAVWAELVAEADRQHVSAGIVLNDILRDWAQTERAVRAEPAQST
jgi:hypothetical protein